MRKSLIEEKPNLNELCHYGVPGMKWGVRKDRGSSGRKESNSSQSENQKFRNSVTSATEKQIRSDVDRYGSLEASERISTYAYNDSVKIMRYETKGKKLTREEAEPYWDLEGELLDRYDAYGWNYAESKRKK